MNSPSRAVAASLSVALFVACGGNDGMQTSHGVNALPLGAVHPASASNLYVANLATVTVYAAGRNSPLRSIDKVEPSDLAFDASGNLFVANIPVQGSGNVTVYRAGTSDVLRKITSNIAEPRVLALDSTGNLYVGNSYFRVEIYPPGSSQPSGYLKVFYPSAMLLDRQNDIYIASDPSPYGRGASRVLVYAPDRKQIRGITQGLSTPIALTLSSQGNLFVANYAADDVTVYARGKTAVLRTISDGIKAPRALVFDAAGNLYVANFAANTVTVYAPGSSTVARTLSAGIARPLALRFDAAGNLYVVNAKSVSVYAPGQDTPSETITQGIKEPITSRFGP